MNKLSLYKFVLMLIFGVFLTNCSTENAGQDFDIERASISVRFMDTPGGHEKVFIEVLDVQLLVIDDKIIPNCWLSLNAIDAGSNNLLDLTGDVETLLVDNLKIPTGTIYEIRLVLGENNSILTNGETISLAMPSIYQEGLVIRDVNFLDANVDYELVLEFDTDQSILRTNTPNYIILKPVIRSKLEALTESI